VLCKSFKYAANVLFFLTYPSYYLIKHTICQTFVYNLRTQGAMDSTALIVFSALSSRIPLFLGNLK